MNWRPPKPAADLAEIDDSQRRPSRRCWDIYGAGGDILDPRDAIPAAARYLAATGAPEDVRSALFAYNRSYAYVDAVVAYARHIKRDPRNLYAYYFWQVFVITTKGDIQLSGPGTGTR